jgi:hypothetical protein
MGDGLPPVSSAASTRRAMLENMGMPRSVSAMYAHFFKKRAQNVETNGSVPPGYAPYAMMPPVSRAGPRLVQDPRLARFVLGESSFFDVFSKQRFSPQQFLHAELQTPHFWT